MNFFNFVVVVAVIFVLGTQVKAIISFFRFIFNYLKVFFQNKELNKKER